MTDQAPPPDADASPTRDLDETNPAMFDHFRDDSTRVRNAAWEDFDGRYRPLIFGVARAMGLSEDAAGDVVQDVHVAMLGALPRFDYDRKRGSFRAYLRTATRNTVYTRFAKEGRNPARPGISGDTLMADPGQFDVDFERVWEMEELERAKASVKEKVSANRWAMFERFFVQEEPAEKVAEDLGVSVDAVYQAKRQVWLRIKEEIAG